MGNKKTASLHLDKERGGSGIGTSRALCQGQCCNTFNIMSLADLGLADAVLMLLASYPQIIIFSYET